jgi:hypothetical protein
MARETLGAIEQRDATVAETVTPNGCWAASEASWCFPSFSRRKNIKRSRNRKFFAIFLLLIDLRPRKQTKTTSV